MNREELHHRFLKIRDAFLNVDKNFRNTDERLQKLGRAADKAYLDSLTWQMMWDCLMALLEKKGLLTKEEFNQELTALRDATQKAMEADAKAKAESAELAKGKVTVVSDQPVIQVVH